MDDILHILELLRQKAEADLLLLSTRRTNLLSELSRITAAIEKKEQAVSDAKIMCVFEKWRQSQICKIRAAERELAGLDDEIAKAKTRYKTILTKNLAAKTTAKSIFKIERLNAEEKQTSAQLDIFLLRAKG